MRCILTKLLVALVLTVALLVPAGRAQAGSSFTWSGAGDGWNWTDPCNWQPKNSCGSTEYPGKTATDDTASIAPLPGGPSHVTLSQAIKLKDLTVTGSSSSLQGQGLTVTGNFDWAGGTIYNAVIATTMNISGTDPKTISSGSINLVSGGTWIDSSTLIFAYQNSSLTNNGTFAIGGDATFQSDCCTTTNPFDNKGTLSITGATSPPPRATFNGTSFLDSGQVTVNNGTLELDKGNHVFANGAQFSGTGRTRITGGGVQLNGNVVLNSGSTLELASGSTAVGGILSGTGTFTGAGTFEWTGGTIRASLSFPAATTWKISGANAKLLNSGYGGGTIDNQGTATWTGSGIIQFDGAPVFRNGGTIQVQNDASMSASQCCVLPVSSFLNLGTLIKTVATGSTVFSGVAFVDSGLVNLQTGTLLLARGNHLLNNGARFTGSGRTVIGDDHTEIRGTITLDPMTELELSHAYSTHGGDLTGAGRFTGGDSLNTGNFIWSGGSIYAALNIDPRVSMQITGPDDKNLSDAYGGGRIDNAGPTWWDSGNVYLQGRVVFNNSGRFVAQNNATFSALSCCTNPATFRNTGEFWKQGGSPTTFHGVFFENSGQVNLTSGDLQVDGGAKYIQLGGRTELPAGTLGSTSQIEIRGGVLGGRTTVTGSLLNAGQIGIETQGNSWFGTLTINGNYVQRPGGVLNLRIGGATAGDFDHLQVNGTATLGGVLRLRLVNGYLPQAPTSFKLLPYTSVSGRFRHVDGLSLPSTALQYNAASLNLTLAPQNRISAGVPSQVLPPTILSRTGQPLVRNVSQTAIDWQVRDRYGHPLANYPLQIKVLLLPADRTSGGHNHGSASTPVRPHGWARLSPATATFPANNGASGSTANVQITQVKTNALGLVRVYYIAPEFGGVEVVRAVSVSNPALYADMTMLVKFQDGAVDLQPLSSSADVQLTGMTAAHGDNHYGTATMLMALAALARNYADEFGSPLKVGNMSLAWGGLFDVGPASTQFWHLPYAMHRFGNNADIGLVSNPRNATFEKILGEQGWWAMTPSLWTSDGNHYHLQLSGTGKVTIVPVLKSRTWRDTTNRLLEVQLNLKNRGGLDAEGVYVSHLTLSNGVTLADLPPPLALGSAAIRKSVILTTGVKVPPGLASFTITVDGYSSSDGKNFTFPAQAVTVTVP